MELTHCEISNRRHFLAELDFKINQVLFFMSYILERESFSKAMVTAVLFNIYNKNISILVKYGHFLSLLN